MKNKAKQISTFLLVVVMLFSMSVSIFAGDLEGFLTVDGEEIAENSLYLYTPSKYGVTDNLYTDENGIHFEPDHVGDINNFSATSHFTSYKMTNIIHLIQTKEWAVEFEYRFEGSFNIPRILFTGNNYDSGFSIMVHHGRVAMMTKKRSVDASFTKENYVSIYCSATYGTNLNDSEFHVIRIQNENGELCLYMDGVQYGAFDQIVGFTGDPGENPTDTSEMGGGTVTSVFSTLYSNWASSTLGTTNFFLQCIGNNYYYPTQGTIKYLKVWEDVTDITFNANGGSCATETMTGYKSETITLPTATNTDPDAIFLGWSDGTNTYGAGADYTIVEAKTLTAVWAGIDTKLSGNNVQISLSLLDNININFKLINDGTTNDLTGYDNFTLVVMDSTGAELDRYTDWKNAGSYLWCPLTVLAKDINTSYQIRYEATDAGGNNVCSPTFTYGVGVYCTNQINKPSNPDELKDLCEAIIDYGTAAAAYDAYKQLNP